MKPVRCKTKVQNGVCALRPFILAEREPACACLGHGSTAAQEGSGALGGGLREGGRAGQRGVLSLNRPCVEI